MANINAYKDSSELTWVFVKKWGKMFVAPREKETWIFNFSHEPREHYIYVGELNVWRSNISAL